MTEIPVIFSDPATVRLPDRPVHLAIGMFDGVHRGHQAVIGSALAAAREAGALAGVFTFWPHPSRVVRPDAPTAMILGREARAGRLVRAGVDFVFEQPFTAAFAAIEAEAFVRWLRGALPRLDTIHVGENWRFGHDRRGDVHLLAALAAPEGVRVVAVPRRMAGGEPVSSSRIRRLITMGAMDEAAGLLGYPYFSDGVVVPGRQLGRTIGFPTLNLDWRPELEPARGVYVVRARDAAGGEPCPGVANYGLRPTVGGAAAPQLEVHLLGACPHGPGDRLHVEWWHFLRPEQRFASIDELRARIAADRDAALAWFASRGSQPAG